MQTLGVARTMISAVRKGGIADAAKLLSLSQLNLIPTQFSSQATAKRWRP